MASLTSRGLNAANLRHHLGALAVLAELDDVVNVADFGELEALLDRFENHGEWMKRGRYDDVMPSEDLGLNFDAAAKIESANSLWDHGEMVSSIRMLQSIDNDSVFKKQSIPVSRSDLLSKIGYQISVAKLEKPHDIQKKYLEPALKELKGRTDGKDAGKVFHQFAMFCDDQLQNSDGLDDLWLHLDEQELRRVEQTRSEFVRLSLENYLLSLIASDEHNNDALRFTALWLERSDDDSTNDAVRRHLDKDQSNVFQRLLINLVYNICIDHPYHSMYQVWSGVKVKANSKDEVAVLRHKATNKVKDQLEKHPTQGAIWHAIDRTNGHYHRLAVDRDNPKYKAGHKINLKETTSGNYLVAALNKYQIPPPTMQLELSADKDYSKVPIIAKLEPQMSIASGGGNDDLRQDAIMEQVFAAVSSLLKLHRETQRRNLGIRTYKVLPLTSASGLIEKEISAVQGKSVDARVSAYRKVKERFHPVMKYFFMEYFVDPDEWFVKRTAYTRTTAAISMLGHILGLGDRHGHNILLDNKTGEVVHIDLGVAFEMGRVLPMPELVPFRLTRDIEDGMGVTKEGVFQRCCEFTLDALREETYSIMTILDVLRYDPLYSWSISPATDERNLAVLYSGWAAYA
ncbi:Serine/threonine-protein kinase TEL1 like [Verticillium longisporum]|uniref:Serine/threonine-protein kinase TEL1 n=1 Tax=Verticillium longisporum TaxID=100787 RepID=A0A8I2ZCN4_VERLO|nr:Serine/threonine-protein kinase TEL1 like [Verticillium longisporum]